METKKKDQRRYTLHSLLRKKQFRVNAFEHKVYAPYYQKEDSLPEQAKELRDVFGYDIQLEIE